MKPAAFTAYDSERKCSSGASQPESVTSQIGLPIASFNCLHRATTGKSYHIFLYLLILSSGQADVSKRTRSACVALPHTHKNVNTFYLLFCVHPNFKVINIGKILAYDISNAAPVFFAASIVEVLCFYSISLSWQTFILSLHFSPLR